MATLKNKIFDLTQDVKELTRLTKDSWSEMMEYACMKALTKHRLEILKFVELVGKTGSRKHVQKLQRFVAELKKLEDTPLNSSTFIKKILVPLKNEREHFELFKKGSVLNFVTSEQVTLIETEAEVETDAIVNRAA